MLCFKVYIRLIGISSYVLYILQSPKCPLLYHTVQNEKYHFSVPYPSELQTAL